MWRDRPREYRGGRSVVRSPVATSVRLDSTYDKARAVPIEPGESSNWFRLHQVAQNADEVAAHGAADAAVVHLEEFLLGAEDELVVDGDLAELFSITAIRLPCCSVRMRLSSVVLPAPRKPVRMVTGTRESMAGKLRE